MLGQPQLQAAPMGPVAENPVRTEVVAVDPVDRVQQVVRLAEDYLLVPRIMGSTVKVPAVVSVVAVLVGGALLGIVGALVAIPVAAALLLLLQEVTFRRLDRS